MSADSQARVERARLRRKSWRVSPLTDHPPAARTLDEALEQMEALRRAGCALAGILYPQGATPRQVRRTWPVERIG